MGAIEYQGRQMPGVQAQVIGEEAAEHLVVLVSNRTGEQHIPQLFVDGKRYKGSVTYRYVADERLKRDEWRQCGNGRLWRN